MSVQFDYYYARESGQFVFYRIPKALFTDPTFRSLSVEAKVLYGLMLDRIGLSARSGWVDEQGRVYIYFTHTEIQEQLQCGHNKAARLLKELDQGMGLIRRKRQGLGKPDRIYVMNFVSAMEVQSSEKGNSDAEQTHPEASETPSMETEQAFQTAQNGNSAIEQTTPEETNREFQTTQNGNSDPQTAVFETSCYPKSGTLACPKEEAIKNDINKNDINDMESIYPIYPGSQIDGGNMMDGMDRTDGMDNAALLREKWGYIALLDNYTPETLESIIQLGADVLSTTAPTLRIGGQTVPTCQVKERLLSLDFTHIDYVLECFQKTTVPIRNIRVYLLTALYNAPNTIDAYYENQFRQHEGIT